MRGKSNIKGVARELLLSSVKRAGSVPSWTITRRNFLFNSSFILLNPFILINSTHAKAISQDPHLSILKSKRGFELSYRGRQWRVLTNNFVGSNHFNISPRLEEGIIVNKTIIRLSDWSFPGFRKRLDFKAIIFRQQGIWRIQLSFYPASINSTTMDLADWMEGRSSEAYLPHPQFYRVGDLYRLSVNGDERSIEWDKNLSVVFRDGKRQIYYLDGGKSAGVVPGKGNYGFAAARVKASVCSQPSELLKQLEPGVQITATTILSFFDIKFLYLGMTNAGQKLTLELRSSDRFEVKNGPPVTIETYQKKRKRKGILTAKGTGTLLVETPGQRISTRLHLEEFSLVSRVGEMSREIEFAAKLSRKIFSINDLPDAPLDTTALSEMSEKGGFGLNAGPVSLRIGGTGEVIQQSFIDGKAGALVFPARLFRAHIPVRGASRADLTFTGTDVDIVIGQRKKARTKTATMNGSPVYGSHEQPLEESLCVAELSLTETQSFKAPLETARLRLARSADLFDLQFGFQNYNLTVSDGVSHLIPRWGFPKCISDFGRPRRVAIFNPQHVQEEVFHYQRGNGEDQPKSLCRECLPVTNKPSSPIRVPGDLSNSALSRTRVAGPTRLVFEETDEEASELRATEITVETITDWTDLALVVHERALPRNALLEEQLDLVGIKPNTSRNEARSKISRTLTPPQEWETALEPVTGLLFSPDPSVLFTTPRKPPVPGDASIWTSHLHLKSNSAVRAIYARGLDDGYLNNVESEDRDYQPFVSSLNAKDRREIVGMTSVYGVAALRRLLGGIDSAKSKHYYDDPKGMVVRPDTSYKYLSKETAAYGLKNEEINVFQEGIVIPKPFLDFDLALTSYRSSLSLRWEGEPPAPLAKAPFFRGAFRIESYIHRAKYGRDALVQVTYKGFLFPLGHRAAYIKLSERTMLPFGNNLEKLMPTGYLTMRQFIVVRNPKKKFPALNQPNGSREFPAKDIELLTTVTPDLATPTPIENELEQTPADGNTDRQKQDAHVFWPRIGKAGTEVNFEFRINGDDTPASSKLIFVDNKAAHSPKVMEALVREYSKGESSKIFKDKQERIIVPQGRTVNHRGVDRKYAETSRSGDTSFRTHSWTLGVEGRTNADEATYEMDALMEGKDQPPFYPRIVSAEIEMQSVDRILGRPQGPIKVKFNHDLYVQHAFDAQRNPSEIYLEVKGPIIKLDFTNQGQSSGGVTKPNAYLAAISRKVGFVGGQAQLSQLKGQAGVVETKLISQSLSFKFNSAKAGQFDPFEFLPDGKILGILEIRDLVKAAAIAAAPQLKEVYKFAGRSIEDLRIQLVKRGPELSRNIIEIIAQADATLKSTLNADIDTTDLYPGLVNELRKFAVISKQVGEKAKALEGVEPDEKVAEQFAPQLTELYGAGKSLIETIDDVMDNPTPAIVGTTITQFHQQRKIMHQAIEGFHDHKAILEELKNQAFGEFCKKLIEQETFELLFGPAAYEDRKHEAVQFPNPPPSASLSHFDDERKAVLKRACKEMLEHPEQIAPNLQRTLFYEVYGRSTSQLLLEIKKIELGGEAFFLWSYRKLGESLTGALKFGLHNCRANVVPQAAWQIMDTVAEELARPIDITNPEDDLKSRLATVAARSQPVLAKLKDQLKQAEVQENKVLEKLAEDIKEEGKKAFKAPTEEAKEKFEKEIKALEAKLGALERQNRALIKLVDEIEKIKPEDLVKHVHEVITNELKAPLESYIVEIEAKAKIFGEDLLSRVLGTFFLLIEQLRDTVIFERLNTTFKPLHDELCVHRVNSDSAFGIVVKLINLVPAKPLAQHLSTAQQALVSLYVPMGISEEYRLKLTLELAATNRSVNALCDVVQNFARIQKHLNTLANTENAVNVCQNLKRFLDPIEQAYDLRRSAINTLGDVFRDLQQMQYTVESFNPQSKLKYKLQNEVVPIFFLVLKELSATAKIDEPGLLLFPNSFINEIKKNSAVVEKEVMKNRDALKAEAKALALEISTLEAKINNTIDAEISQMTQRVADFVATQEKKLVARILQGLFLGGDTVVSMSAEAALLVANISETLNIIYDPAESGLDKLMDLVGKAENDDYTSQLMALLAKPAIDELKKANSEVEKEHNLLIAIATAARGFAETQNISKADKLLENIDKLKDSVRGSDGVPRIAIIQATTIVARLAEALASGLQDKIFDFDLVRDQLKAAIVELIPSRVSQSYDWDTELSPFPSSSPIFDIDRTLETAASNDKEIVLPMTKEGKLNDLVLKTHIEIDLLSGDRKVSTIGEMRPFKINLLGGVIDLVTIGFKGMRVISQNGSKPKITATIAEVEIGQALSFLQALAPFLGPKPDNGPYVRLSLSPFGVVAGYRFSAPVIPVGAMLFSGISIMAETILPFENQQATFSFAFASKRNPFLVSVPPYGGGGFVGLLASPKGVISFEIQIEFGAVVPIEFGPLKAMGRVTAGIYLMSRPGLRVLEGFVRSVGEGCIAFFSISVCLEVTIRQQNGGSMVGSSSFFATFKVAFTELTYGFTASYAVKGGGGEAEESQPMALAASRFFVTDTEKCVATISSLMPDRRTQWAKYKKCFKGVGENGE